MTIADELKKFQGTWKQIAYERDGRTKPPDEEGLETRTIFVDDSFVVMLADGSTLIKGTFKLDLTQNPKAVDWTDTFGADAGKTFLAIYALDGDRLMFCAAEAGQERPKEFRPNAGQVLRVHQRVCPG